jgi:hypothetical protein
MTPATSPTIISQMVDWTTGAGRVFAVGSINTGKSLHADPNMAALFRNVLHEFGIRQRMYVLALGTNGFLQVATYNGTAWGTLIQDSTSSVGSEPPAGVQWGKNSLAIMVISGGVLSHRLWTGAGWSAWSPLTAATSLVGRPAVVGWARQRMDVFALDSIGDVLWNTYDGSAWSGWSSLGSSLAGDPSVANWEGNHLSIAIRGSGGNVLYRELNDHVWGSWQNFGGNFSVAPTMLTWGGKHLSIFEVNSAGALVWKHRKEGVWQEAATTWNSLGFAPDSAGTPNIIPLLQQRVQAALWGPTHYMVVGVGTDLLLKVLSWDGATRNWSSLLPIPGATPVGEPVITTHRGKYVWLMVRGSDGALWRQEWNGGAWLGWQSMGGALTGSPGIFSWVSSL